MPALVAISIGGGIFLAIIVLMVGYVNADSKRRGMNSLLWTLLVIFIPKALGFLAYFLLRKPLLIPCPNCGTEIGSDYRYCPKCGHAVTPMCGHCGATIQRDYAVCPYCGKPVSSAGDVPAIAKPVSCGFAAETRNHSERARWQLGVLAEASQLLAEILLTMAALRLAVRIADAPERSFCIKARLQLAADCTSAGSIRQRRLYEHWINRFVSGPRLQRYHINRFVSACGFRRSIALYQGTASEIPYQPFCIGVRLQTINSLCIRARLQPCRNGATMTWASAPAQRFFSG